MPNADEALKGLLSDGVSSAEVIAKLEDAGYTVTPSAEDEGEEGSPASELDANADKPADEMAAMDTEDEESEGPATKDAGDGGLLIMSRGSKDRRMGAIDEAMKEKGF